MEDSLQQKCLYGKYSSVKRKTVEKHKICVHTACVVSTQCRKTQRLSLSQCDNMATNVHWSLRDRSKLRVTRIADIDGGLRFRWSLLRTHRVTVHRRCSLTVPQNDVFHSTSLQKVKMAGSIFSTKLASQLSNTGNRIGTLVISVCIPLPILGAFEDISEKCVVPFLNELNGGKM